MAKFTLDTSGAVCAPHKNAAGQTFVSTLWSDLSPFAQGYVEAMFAGGVSIRGYGGLMRVLQPKAKRVGFSDLAPSTLAAILKDCAARQAQHAPDITRAIVGRMFWNHRQRGVVGAEFPPLTAYLGDDGKVYLEPRA